MIQKQLSRQSQLIDQNFSNGIMLNAISSLENLAFFYGFKGKRIFDYYSGYAHPNNENELINAVILQLEIFRNSHSDYSSIYSNYDFPKNLNKDQIIKYIKEWKKYIPNKTQIYYDEIISYLNGNSNYSGLSEIIDKKKKEWGPTTKEDLERIGRSTPFINTQMFNEMDKIKEHYNKTGNYDITANLNKDRKDNIDMYNFNQYDQKFSEQSQDCIAVEKRIEKLFENLFNPNYCPNDSDVNELKRLVELFQKLMKEIRFQETKNNQKIYLYNSYKKKIPIVFQDKHAINFFNEICNMIIACYGHENYSYR